MARILKLSIIISVLIQLPISWSQDVCDNPDSPESTRIYFTNGMNTPLQKSLQHLENLRATVGSTQSTSYGITYNDNEFLLIDIAEAFGQNTGEYELLWDYLENLNQAPQWFKTLYAQKTKQYIANNDADLQEHISQYNKDIRSGKKVVIVSHSQGNFYANYAREEVIRRNPEYTNNIRIVGVASPSHFVSGSGDYTTNSYDKIINIVRNIYPDTLRANVSTNTPTPDDHGFSSSYLPWFGSRIRSHVNEARRNMRQPQKDCNPVAIETVRDVQGNFVDTYLVFHAIIQQGNNLSWWVQWSLGNSVQDCEFREGNYPDGGTRNAGDRLFTENVHTSFSRQNYYTWRACAKNSDGVIGQGEAKTFWWP